MALGAEKMPQQLSMPFQGTGQFPALAKWLKSTRNSSCRGSHTIWPPHRCTIVAYIHTYIHITHIHTIELEKNNWVRKGKKKGKANKQKTMLLNGIYLAHDILKDDCHFMRTVFSMLFPQNPVTCVHNNFCLKHAQTQAGNPHWVTTASNPANSFFSHPLSRVPRLLLTSAIKAETGNENHPPACHSAFPEDPKCHVRNADAHLAVPHGATLMPPYSNGDHTELGASPCLQSRLHTRWRILISTGGGAHSTTSSSHLWPFSVSFCSDWYLSC